MSDNQELLRQRLEEHGKVMADRLHNQLYNSAVLRALDIIALEAMKLEISDWENMTVRELRTEIKFVHNLQKEGKFL